MVVMVWRERETNKVEKEQSCKTSKVEEKTNSKENKVYRHELKAKLRSKLQKKTERILKGVSLRLGVVCQEATRSGDLTIYEM